MAMAVYDDKSDHDNPFVEPLFDLIIHKAKVTKTDPFTLFIKTKSMHFTIETNSEVNDVVSVRPGMLENVCTGVEVFVYSYFCLVSHKCMF